MTAILGEKISDLCVPALLGDSLRATQVDVHSIAMVLDISRGLKQRLGVVGAELGDEGPVLGTSLLEVDQGEKGRALNPNSKPMDTDSSRYRMGKSLVGTGCPQIEVRIG